MSEACPALIWRLQRKRRMADTGCGDGEPRAWGCVAAIGLKGFKDTKDCGRMRVRNPGAGNLKSRSSLGSGRSEMEGHR